MPRASDVQKTERLNRALVLLQQVEQLSDAVEKLARDCSISSRQAYRYLEQAQQLKGPVPPGEAKLAFTVKLPHSRMCCKSGIEVLVGWCRVQTSASAI